MNIIYKTSVVIVLLFPLLVLAAGPGPEEVYAGFHKASLNADRDGLNEYGSSQGGKEMDEMPAEMREMMLSLQAKMTPETYKVSKVEIDGDTAKLIMTTEKEGNEYEGSALLVLEDDNWKVHEVDWSSTVVNDIEIDMITGEVREVPAKDQKAVQINPNRANGKINGEDFIVESASFKSGQIELRQGEDFFADRSIVIFLLSHKSKLDSEGKIVIDPADFSAPHIHMKYKLEGKNVPDTEIFMNKYSMTLESRGDEYAIDLRLPDSHESYVSGTFTVQ